MLSKTFICALLLQSGYTFPVDELGYAGGSYFIEKSSAKSVSVDWDSDTNEVVTKAWVASPMGTKAFGERSDSPEFQITAIAPKYYDAFFVIGTRNDGVTKIERWKPVAAVHPNGQSLNLFMQKTPIFSSATFTHIRAAAADSNGQFLLLQKHETSDIVRFDLSTYFEATVALASAYPNLQKNDILTWKKHVTNGVCFLSYAGDRSKMDALEAVFYDDPHYLYLWDANQDGNPETMEEISIEESEIRGYNDIDSFYPARKTHGVEYQ